MHHTFHKEIIIYIHQWVSTQWINVQSQRWEKVQWGIKSFLQTYFRLLHLQDGRLHRRQKMQRPKNSWRQNERRRSGSLWVIWSLWTGHLQVFFCCRLKNVNMQRRLRCEKCQAVQTNARRRCFTETFSHLFLCYLLSSTSTSAEWSRPRFLWENAPPALSLPLFPEEHPSHTGNDILKRRKKKTVVQTILSCFLLRSVTPSGEIYSCWMFVSTLMLMVTGLDSSGSSPFSKRCMILIKTLL